MAEAPDTTTGLCLHVTADIDHQMLLRILGVLARQSIIPRSVSAIYADEELSLDIGLDEAVRAAAIRAEVQIAAIVGVRSVRRD